MNRYSESMSAGGWLNGGCRTEVDWWLDAPMPGASDPNLLCDPFIAASPMRSIRVWSALSPREEVTALADHSLYCRKAGDAELMDPFGEDWMNDLGDPATEDCSLYETCSGVASPSTSAEPKAFPGVDDSHMAWLETFGPISSDCDGLPSDLDAAADDVDWAQWQKYLEEENPDTFQTQVDLDPNAVYTMITPMSLPSTSTQMEYTDQKLFATTSSCNVVPKDEYEMYEPQCDDVKPPVMTPFFSTQSSTPLDTIHVPLKNVKEEVYDQKPLVNRRPVKSNRGRPKKIRIPEDKNRMNASERRRAMNRDAALRYRERRKADLDALRAKQYALEALNDGLRQKECKLQQQITEIRENLRAVGCPVF